MLFNSLAYIAFFLTVYLLYRLTPRRLQNILLLVASYVFYAWWDVRFLFLIILSTVLNYCCGILSRTGSLDLKSRVAFSAWVVSAFFFTVIVQWSNLPGLQSLFVTRVDWGTLTEWNESGTMFLALCLSVLLANLVYPKIDALDERRKKEIALYAGIAVNLLILGFFKYYNFFITNVEWLLSGIGFTPSRLHLDIILPVGISFYTFKGISYVVDSYRGQVRQAHGYHEFALFMAFFPSLLAGPIDRAEAFLRQICEKRNLSWEQSVRGLHLFLFGLFKKIVIADGVIRTVSSVFDSTGQASWIDVVIATLLFTVQIYCDFSGYTDMARGTAKMFGIDLMINFRFPYFSRNPREFWYRWHISLSTWLRDYLYIPLGGNRRGGWKTSRNLVVTMLLGGLWHGAAWNFVLWGGYHGIVLWIHRAMTSARSSVRKYAPTIKDVAAVTLFFLVVSYGWLLFRAPSLEKIASLTTTLIFDFGNLNYGAAYPRLAAIIGMPILLIIELIERAGAEKPFYRLLPVPAWTALYAAMIFNIAIGMTTESTQFIYMVF